MGKKRQHECYGPWTWIGLAGLTLVTMLIAVCVGSVSISIGECLQVFRAALTGTEGADPGAASILLAVRLPRVLCVALSGASLSVCGAAMQGLLKNPLADGSTLGISSGTVRVRVSDPDPESLVHAGQFLFHQHHHSAGNRVFHVRVQHYVAGGDLRAGQA